MTWIYPKNSDSIFNNSSSVVAPRLRATGLPYIASPEIMSSGNAQHIGTETTALFKVQAGITVAGYNYYEAWRHMVCGNTMYIIYLTFGPRFDEVHYGSGTTR